MNTYRYLLWSISSCSCRLCSSVLWRCNWRRSFSWIFSNNLFCSFFRCSLSFQRFCIFFSSLLFSLKASLNLSNNKNLEVSKRLTCSLLYGSYFWRRKYRKRQCLLCQAIKQNIHSIFRCLVVHLQNSPSYHNHLF